MAVFQYIARGGDGKEVAGVMQADNESAVARTLDEKRLFPVRIVEQAPKRKALSFRRKVRLRELGMVYGQLGDLLSAGVPLMRALEILVKLIQNPRLSDKMQRVRDAVAAGQPLADAMEVHGEVFLPLHTAMLRAGERAGFLEEVLSNLAGFIERQDDLQSRVRGALIYPAVLTSLGLVILTGLLIFLVPSFKAFFSNATLPLPTIVLFAASDLLVKHQFILALLVVLAVIGIRAALRSERGRLLWETWRLKLPLAGRAVRMVAITRFCRILGTLLANGVSILQALAISKDATGCGPMARSIQEAAENIRAGQPLAEPLRNSGLFTAEVVEMIAVGEESNQLEKVLLHIADIVERRTNRQVDNAVRLIEPLILVLLASAIGFIAVGLFYPIFNMAQMMR